MMASAFYPTGDGHIGNLGKKTLSELKDLLARQEKLMKNKNVLNTLPDKGAKIIQFADTLQRTIKSREKTEEMFGAKSSCENKTELTPVRKDGHQGKSRFKKERQKVTDSTVNRIGIDLDIQDTETESKVQAEQKAFSGDVLERPFEMLSVADDGGNSVEDDHSVQPKHFYEIAEERAKQNAGDMKQPLKLNSSLRISHFQDLPEIFMPPKFQRDVKMELDKPQVTESSSDPHRSHVVAEETAATPPTYKYEKVREISLDESLMLQTSQKVKQDELQAEIAAERLAERLHIKLETYNPEGVDMSYRVKHSDGQAHMVDSDDDEDNDDDDADDNYYEREIKIISESDDDT